MLSVDQNKLLLRATGIKVRSSSGTHARAHCPHHKDTNPSLSVDFRKGVYFCFSCKRQGTLPQLVYEMTGRGARHYVKVADPDAGAPFDFQADTPAGLLALGAMYMDEPTPEEILADYDHLDEPEIHGTLIPWHKSTDVQNWMKERLIPKRTAEDWGFMYGLNIEVISPMVPEDPEEERSRFQSRRRLIVPLHGPAGNWISVESRSILPHDKLKTLYVKPMDFIFRYPWLDTSKPLYVCEGLVDAARLYPIESNVTYMFGSHLSEVKKHLLKQFPYIIMIPDNDIAGYELVERFVTAGLTTYIKPVVEGYEDLGDRTLTNYQIRRWFVEEEPTLMDSDKIRVILDRWRRREKLDEHIQHIAYR